MQPLAFETEVASNAVGGVRGCTPAVAIEPCLASPTTFMISANCSSTIFELATLGSLSPGTPAPM